MCMTFSYCCIVSAHNSMMLKYFYLNITLDHPSPFPRFSFSVFQSCPAYDSASLFKHKFNHKQLNLAKDVLPLEAKLSLPSNPPSALISIPCTSLGKQGWYFLGWCSIGSEPDPYHHITTSCWDVLVRGREKASTAECRREKEQRGLFQQQQWFM